MRERPAAALRARWEREKAVLLRCEVSVCLIGLACHAAGMFGGLSFYDDVTCTYDVGTTHIFGRFTLALLGKITRLPFGGSNYSLPWFNGLVSFLFLGIFAWMTVRLLRLEAAWLQVLVSGILVAFPVITSLFAYWFTAPYYMLALPMCGAAAYCFTLRGDAAAAEGAAGRRKRALTVLVGIALTALLIGIYQAYLPVLLTLEVLILIRDEMEMPYHQNRRWGYALGGTVIGFAGYLVLMQISLTLTGKELYSYRGLETLGTEGSSYLTRILWAYRIFFDPGSFEELRNSTDYLMFMWSMETVYKVILALSIVLAVIGGWLILQRRGAAENPAETESAAAPRKASARIPSSLPSFVRYLILTGMFPLVVNFIFVMTDFDVYSLMLYAQVFVFLYPLMMGSALGGQQEASENAAAAQETGSGEQRPEPAGTDSPQKSPLCRNLRAAGRGMAALAALLAGYGVVFYCRYDNLCYYKAGRMQDAAIAYDEILIARIMAVEGYDASLPVCFVDGLEKDVTGWTVDEELAGANITPYSGLEIINGYSWVSFMRIHCGYAPTVIEDYLQYDAYIEEEGMPSYPAEGSIRIVDGVIVVNF